MYSNILIWLRDYLSLGNHCGMVVGGAHMPGSTIATDVFLIIISDHLTEQQEKSFTTLKQLVTQTPVLKYFDPSKPVKISVDASSKGMGAVLLQDVQPVAYASNALTKSQQNYAQIEKEMLAIVFGCTRFHEYIFRLQTVEIDRPQTPRDDSHKAASSSTD